MKALFHKIKMYMMVLLVVSYGLGRVDNSEIPMMTLCEKQQVCSDIGTMMPTDYFQREGVDISGFFSIEDLSLRSVVPHLL